MTLVRKAATIPTHLPSSSQVFSFCSSSSSRELHPLSLQAFPANMASRQPLLHLEDVRARIRKFLRIDPNNYPPHLPSSSSSPSFPFPARPSAPSPPHSSLNIPPEPSSSASVFDIGTIGPSLADDAVASSNRAELDSREPNWQAPRGLTARLDEREWQGPPPEDYGRPILDIEDAREFFQRVGEICGRIRRWGLPETSWQNKMPWHVPRAAFLAKGLQWPPERFDSEEQRRNFYKEARKRKPFMFGSPPTWTFMLANVFLLSILIYGPRIRFPI